MNERDLHLTPAGAAKIRRELEEMRGPRRDAIAARLRHAVRQGDLAENADYITAKEEQAFLEGKILELETILREAKIVEDTGPSDVVRIGSTVVVSLDGDKTEVFTLVGLKEANPRQGKISHESPIGQALIGRRVGEAAAAITPGGRIEITVLEIR